MTANDIFGYPVIDIDNDLQPEVEAGDWSDYLETVEDVRQLTQDELGAIIAGLRSDAGMSQTELAKLARCSINTVGDVEYGRNRNGYLIVRLLNILKPGAFQYNGVNGQGKCGRCGTVLFAIPEQVPEPGRNDKGWITHWHIDCGGYCPECVLSGEKTDRGIVIDGDKLFAKRILEELTGEKLG